MYVLPVGFLIVYQHKEKSRRLEIDILAVGWSWLKLDPSGRISNLMSMHTLLSPAVFA